VVEIRIGGRWVALRGAFASQIAPNKYHVEIPMELLCPIEPLPYLEMRIDGQLVKSIQHLQTDDHRNPNGSGGSIILLALTE